MIARTIRRVAAPALLAVSISLTVATVPSGAATKTTYFCVTAPSLAAAPTLTLPSSDSLSSLENALQQLTADSATLTREHRTLTAISAASPSATLRAYYDEANAAIVAENVALNKVVANATNLVGASSSSPYVNLVANALIGASANAATANTLLTVAKPIAKLSCVVKPAAKKVVKHTTKKVTRKA